jgi:hypothetical protein
VDAEESQGARDACGGTKVDARLEGHAMSESWSTTGRFRWLVRYPVGYPPTTLKAIVERRVLQQEWVSEPENPWRDGTREWRDVPTEEEVMT